MEISLYNSIYIQYLISNGIYISNQSTGKFNLLPDWTDKELDNLIEKFIKSGKEMKNDGFFEKKIKLNYFLIIWRFLKSWIIIQYKQIMLDKEIDIEVSHNHPVNKFTHFWSSVGMILFAYTSFLFYGDAATSMTWFLITHILRQAGHFFYEKQDRDWEKQKFGHKDGSKKAAAVMILLLVMLYYYTYFVAFYIAYPNYDDKEYKAGKFQYKYFTIDSKESKKFSLGI